LRTTEYLDGKKATLASVSVDIGRLTYKKARSN
jgi:hypothetical protein